MRTQFAGRRLWSRAHRAALVQPSSGTGLPGCKGGWHHHRMMVPPKSVLPCRRHALAARVNLNVTDGAAADALVDALVKEYGGLHILVSNAASPGTRWPCV